MSTVVTGAFGRVGTALIDYASKKTQFSYCDRIAHPELPTEVLDISNLSDLEKLCRGAKSMVHLAASSRTDASWSKVLKNNIVGTYNCFEAARKECLETVVFASTNHVVGMYERENAPDIYNLNHGLYLDGSESTRPDSYYAVSKVFGEGIGRFYVENFEYPKRVYALRLGRTCWPKDDHPFSVAERGVKNGKWSPDSRTYDRKVKRLKALWLSRRDSAQLIEKCIDDNSVTFDIFYGTSNNPRGWLDLGRAESLLGYQPVDNGEQWTSPPQNRSTPEDSAAFSIRGNG
jgi:nucleoside-diphosphate-sugar epimerase